MKDLRGIQRGKCNSCDCEEYISPPTSSGKHRCEYCNHTPVEHVRIEKLGKCNKCGDCEEYQSEDNNSYTECGYCGCEASDHAGAEKFRRYRVTNVRGMIVSLPDPGMINQPSIRMPNTMVPNSRPHSQPPQQQFASLSVHTPDHHVLTVSTKEDESNESSQAQDTTSTPDVCKLPGCDKPCYVDEQTGRTHDFCRRTHAREFRSMIVGQHHKESNRHEGPEHSVTASTKVPDKTSKEVKVLTSSDVRGSTVLAMKQGSFTSGVIPSSTDDITVTSQSYRQPLQVSGATSLYSNHMTTQSSHMPPQSSHLKTHFTSKQGHRQPPVTIDGVKWPTTEHYFQAQKFVGTPYVDMIRHLSAPRQAFQMSRDPRVSHWRRSDWESVKDDVMYKALQCKFDQHPNLRNKLMESGNKKLIEHTTNDSYWGDGGGEGRGLNKLGQLLMKVRDEMNTKYGSSKKGKSDNHMMFEQLESTLNPGETSRNVRGIASPLTSRKNYSQQPMKRSASFTSGVVPSSTNSTSSVYHTTSERPKDDITVTSQSYRQPLQVSGATSLYSNHMTTQSSHMTTQSSHMTTQSSHMTLQSSHMTPQSSHLKTHFTSKQGHRQSPSKDDSALKQVGEKTPGRARLRRTASYGNIHDSSKSSTGSHKAKVLLKPAPSSLVSKRGYGTPPKHPKTSSKQPTVKPNLTISSRSSSLNSKSGRRQTNQSSVGYNIINHHSIKETRL